MAANAYGVGSPQQGNQGGGGDKTSVERLDAADVVTIAAKQQMIVYNCVENSGEVVNSGHVIVTNLD